jgi:hypothetical protein
VATAPQNFQLQLGGACRVVLEGVPSGAGQPLEKEKRLGLKPIFDSFAGNPQVFWA